MKHSKNKVSIRDLEPETIEKMRSEYESGEMSLGKLAARENVSKTQLWRLAKKECWKKPKRKEVAKAISCDFVAPNPGGILGDVAVRKIEEIVKELGPHYSPVDEQLIVAYAKSYQRMLRLEAIVDAEGESVYSPKTGATYMNPNFSALQAVISNMTKIGDKLGLSIASRRRLGIRLGTEETTESLFDFVDAISDFDSDDVEV